MLLWQLLPLLNEKNMHSHLHIQQDNALGPEPVNSPTCAYHKESVAAGTKF